MTMLRVARISKPHGLLGEVTLGPTPLTADEFSSLRHLTWEGRDGTLRELTLVHARGHRERLVARFGGVETAEQAAVLAGGWLTAESASLPDPGPGLAYHFQLVGCEVVTEEGRTLGTLAEIWATGAHEVFVVRGAGEVLIPAIPPFLKSVALAERRITVHLIPGMEAEGPAQD